MQYRKIGGIHFLRIGRLQVSGCLCRPNLETKGRYPMKTLAALTAIAFLAIPQSSYARDTVWSCVPKQSVAACKRDLREACKIDHVPRAVCAAVKLDR